MDSYRRILSREERRRCNDDVCSPPPPPPLPPPPPPPPPPRSFDQEGHARRLTNFLLIATAIFAASLLLSLTYYAVLRRRRRPLGGAAAGPAFDDDDDDAVSLDEGAPSHPVWYIRTVGLDESTIGSIAVAEYRAGDGLLDGESDCSVCLGEFHDGDRVRLLPKCGHAFHVSCIDTWLRAHVNCPFCRAHIVDPNTDPATTAAATAAAALPITTAGGSVDLNAGSTVLETPQIGIQPIMEQEQQNGGGPESLTGVPIIPSYVFDVPPESAISRVQSDPLGCGLRPVQRSFSMDTPWMSATIFRVEPEEGTIDEEGNDPNLEEENIPKNSGKLGNSSRGAVDQKSHSDIERSLSSSGRGFFFSRHGRVSRIHTMPM